MSPMSCTDVMPSCTSRWANRRTFSIMVDSGTNARCLRRAFQLAGARTLIVSLWPIEDEATRHWMRALYTARRAGASTVDAVQAAVRDGLQEQRSTGGTTHPYFWGGFVSIGDWR